MMIMAVACFIVLYFQGRMERWIFVVACAAIVLMFFGALLVRLHSHCRWIIRYLRVMRMVKNSGMIAITAKGTVDLDSVRPLVRKAKCVKCMSVSGGAILRNLHSAIEHMIENGGEFHLVLASPQSDFVRNIEKIEQRLAEGEISAEINLAISHLRGIIDKARSTKGSTRIKECTYAYFTTHLRLSLVAIDDRYYYAVYNLPPHRTSETMGILYDRQCQSNVTVVNQLAEHFDAVIKDCKQRNILSFINAQPDILLSSEAKDAVRAQQVAGLYCRVISDTSGVVGPPEYPYDLLASIGEAHGGYSIRWAHRTDEVFYESGCTIQIARLRSFNEKRFHQTVKNAFLNEAVRTHEHAMLILLTGLPGSGKSTLARELATQLGAIHLNFAILCNEIYGAWPHFISDYKMCAAECAKFIKQALQDKKVVLYDTTAITESIRDYHKRTIPPSAKFAIVWRNTPAEICRARLAKERPFTAPDLRPGINKLNEGYVNTFDDFVHGFELPKNPLVVCDDTTPVDSVGETLLQMIS